jgi:Trypsin-co-occurring domain 1
MDEDGESLVVVKLTDGTKLAIRAEQIGPAPAADEEIDAKFETVAKSIEGVGRDILAAARRVSPQKATVELAFGLAVESGHLIALFGRGKGEASIKVTLEWAEGHAPDPV